MFIINSNSEKVDYPSTKESHRRSGKEKKRKIFFKKYLEKAKISPNLNKSSHAKMFSNPYNMMYLEDSFKTSKGHHLRQFDKVTRTFVAEITRKTSWSLEVRKCRKKMPSSFSGNTNVQHKLYRTPSIRALGLSALMKTKH